MDRRYFYMLNNNYVQLLHKNNRFLVCCLCLCLSLFFTLQSVHLEAPNTNGQTTFNTKSPSNLPLIKSTYQFKLSIRTQKVNNLDNSGDNSIYISPDEVIKSYYNRDAEKRRKLLQTFSSITKSRLFLIAHKPRAPPITLA